MDSWNVFSPTLSGSEKDGQQNGRQCYDDGLVHLSLVTFLFGMVKWSWNRFEFIL